MKNVKVITLRIDPIADLLVIGALLVPQNGVHKYNQTSVPLCKLGDVMEALKSRGFDSPKVSYTSKYYGVELRYSIN